MLLTITTTYVPATDLGYLLHKHPARVQTFGLSFGRAYVFCPEASFERCTAALLLDIDPLQLAQTRHTPASHDFVLQPYVNDRPYVASSFLSVAIAEVFGTALSGRCKERPELAVTPLPLQARLAVLPCSGGESVLRCLFEPLCYHVTAERHPLDELLPAWGDSEYYTVTLTGTMRLGDLLSHLYVLVPVLDDDKHYWIGDDEVAKLLRQQFAPVGAAGQAASAEALAALQQAAERGVAVEALASRYRERAAMVARYAEAYQRFCWPVHSVEDLRLAPFHLLATEGAVHVDKTQQWHLDTLGRIVAASSSSCLQMTASRVHDLTDTAAETEMIAWWQHWTNQGGEGMVVKPLDFIARGRRGLAQPAMKCRGRDYLRLIYGPEYTAPEHLARLRVRHLGVKRALALREFALGIEALERFVRREPLRHVHACVFSALALESEAVDPRL